MKYQKYLIPLAMLVLLGYAFAAYDWAGLALVFSGLVLWALLHFTRLMKVMERAAKRPMGYVDSAVMLNAKLKVGVNLLHVVALTRSLGVLRTPKDSQPEVYAWTDNSDSVVTCTFVDGRLTQWDMVRPTTAAEPDAVAVSGATAASSAQQVGTP